VAGRPPWLLAPDHSISAPEVFSVRWPILCYVTDRKLLAPGEGGARTGVVRQIRDTIAAGVDWVQIREKDLAAGELLGLVRQATSASEAGGAETGGSMRSGRGRTKIMVNDRLDLALAGAAAGVHLGQESAPVADVVRWCRKGNAPREFIVGVSSHSVGEAREAENAGASYVIFGPVFDTPSKRAFGQPLGIAQLSLVCAALKIPVLAIGGIEARNARECWRAGAAGIAAIRMFQDTRDRDELKTTIDRLRNDPATSATR
jgi:thiamine-phosphate pyrophosphorylase